jgi:hypothetical protein
MEGVQRLAGGLAAARELLPQPVKQFFGDPPGLAARLHQRKKRVIELPGSRVAPNVQKQITTGLSHSVS